MKHSLLNLIVRMWPQLSLFGIVFILFVTNYPPGTYLTGWDNLHPEFSFSVNLKRSIFAVWQEYQGLGLLGGMGHAADLVHQIVLLPFSWIIPDNLLRYFWIFLMLLVGTLGVYFLAQKLIFRSKEKIWPFLAAAFYLLNLATIQIFYVPFEAFVAHFASLPWLLLTSLLYFKSLTKKHFTFFTVVLLLSTPAAYIPTLFVVYILSLLILSTSIIIVKILKKGGVKILLTGFLRVFIIIAIVNAFWLLPFLYFTAANSEVVLNAQINTLSTEGILLRNKAFGNITDATLLKGFLFDNIDPDLSGNAAYMFEPWRTYLSNSFIPFIGYILFAVTFIGFVGAVKTKNPTKVAFGILFLFAFTMLATNILPFSLVSTLFRKIALFDQAFRFPFTKFSVLAALAYSLFFAFGIKTIAQWSELKIKAKTATPLLIISFGFIVLLTIPAFIGYLFYQREKLTLPSAYFQVFDFFKNQEDKGRIANFPQHTFWGWTFYDWGYSGSGFLWYGIEQPMLDRAFDVWSRNNENYYWEISYALYSQNQRLFEDVLDKYQVSWILLDKNVINPSSPKALYLNELENTLSSSKFNLAQTFGDIEIYKVDLEAPTKDFVFLAQNLPSIGPVYNWNNLDTAYWEYGDYTSPLGDSSLVTRDSIYYPFRSLFTGKEQKDIEFQVEAIPTSFVLKSKIPLQLQNYRVEIPKADSQDLLAFPQRAYMRGVYLYIHIPKLGGNLTTKIDPTKIELPLCAKSKNGIVELTSNNGATCSISVPLETLPHNVSYLITVKNHNVKGKPIVFWLENLNSRKADIETNLPANKGLTESFFIQPPMDPFGRGYSLHFDNISIGKEEVINILNEIEIQPLPFNFLRSIKLVPPDSTATLTTLTTPTRVSHPNPAFYEITPGSIPESTTLVLSQSFDKGWAAYALNSTLHFPFSNYFAPLLGQRIKNHILVNNWANGWELDQSEAGLPAQPGKAIVIVYLPQYLEFAGFALLLGFGALIAITWLRR